MGPAENSGFKRGGLRSEPGHPVALVRGTVTASLCGEAATSVS